VDFGLYPKEKEMPDGGTGKTVMTLGYDPQNNRYVGTFIGSMMTLDLRRLPR